MAGRRTRKAQSQQQLLFFNKAAMLSFVPTAPRIAFISVANLTVNFSAAARPVSAASRSWYTLGGTWHREGLSVERDCLNMFTAWSPGGGRNARLLSCTRGGAKVPSGNGFTARP